MFYKYNNIAVFIKKKIYISVIQLVFKYLTQIVVLYNDLFKYIIEVFKIQKTANYINIMAFIINHISNKYIIIQLKELLNFVGII